MSQPPQFHGPQDYLHLAQSPGATAEQLTQLAGSEYAFVRAAVAGNPNTPPDVLDLLLPSGIESSTDVEIAMAIMRNPATHGRTLARGPLLRNFLKDLVATSGDRLLAFIDGVEASDSEDSTFSLGTTKLVVDVTAGVVNMIDTAGEHSQARIAVEVLRSWVRNVAAVTPRLRDRIRADFGDGSLSEVVWTLGWLPSSSWPPTERLPAAAILFAGGDWYRLLDFVWEANIDFRDALILGSMQHADWLKRLDVELS